MQSRICRGSSIFILLVAVVAGCSASDGEEMDEATSAHRKQYECEKGGRYDVKPLGDYERKTLADHRPGNWRFDNGAKAETKDGRTVMGAPGDEGRWIFCIEDGDRRMFRVVDGEKLRTTEVDVELELMPLHNKGACRKNACENARRSAKRCADKRKAYDPDGGLTVGFAWMEAEADVEDACKDCRGGGGGGGGGY